MLELLRHNDMFPWIHIFSFARKKPLASERLGFFQGWVGGGVLKAPPGFTHDFMEIIVLLQHFPGACLLPATDHPTG